MTVLVTGATGQQGGATARALLRAGRPVRALVRSVSSPAAQALAAEGAELVPGDLTDRASLDRAMSGVDGVFSVQPAGVAPHFNPDEVRMGVTVADAAAAAGVGHLVYTSVGGADRDTGVSHWNTKGEIERHIAALGLPATILRPVMFMENHADPQYGVLGRHSVLRMVAPGQHVQMIAVRDIGEFAALAFADPGYYVGRALELAGDDLPREALVAAVERTVGHPLDLPPLPAEAVAEMRANVDRLHGVESFGGWQADVPALRALHPGLLTFDDWLASWSPWALQR
ncbi:NmrA family NAD(P)-binding protein [Dactylosporangium sp. NPDC005572]|uniref:NmrA family NAD(P)-binding protein n=1 Tax=Dactylosporangium sp. NPDC005572 TaxID=3156889 RepID=UPI0033BCFA64